MTAANKGSSKPLRERRRETSRTAFVDAAKMLFDTQGFSETTMAQIADAAGLHIQTLYNHFPTKQTLASTVTKERFRDALAERSSDTLHFWRDWVRRSAQAQIDMDGGATFFQSIIVNETDPKLMGVSAELGREYVKLISRSIAQDLDLDVDQDRLPVLIANMCWGANFDAIRRWSKSGGEADLVALTVEAAEDVIDAANVLLDAAGHLS